MERLVHEKLFGQGLLVVDSPRLVERYNEALGRLGLDPTRLRSFAIDGIGWSPQIAAERDDPMYLSHGVPNQLGIILSPEQENRPIYFPFRSFDRQLMQQYFHEFRAEIVDITVNASIQIEVDQGMTSYTTPRDLLLIDSVIVRSSANGLIQGALEQHELVREFRDSADAWFDAGLRQRIIENARSHGDLRYRRVHIPDMSFGEIQDFHTAAFGGVFVLRSGEGDPMLIAEDPAALEGLDDERVELFHVGDLRLLDRLHQRGFIEIDLGWYRKNPERLREVYDRVVNDFLCTDDPSLRLEQLTPQQRTRRLVERQSKAPAVILELEQLLARLRGPWKPNPTHVSRELQTILLHPTERLSPASRRVVWQLLCGFQPWNVHRLYIYRRNRFFELFVRWPESKQEWAISLIRQRYRSEMTS